MGAESRSMSIIPAVPVESMASASIVRFPAAVKLMITSSSAKNSISLPLAKGVPASLSPAINLIPPESVLESIVMALSSVDAEEINICPVAPVEVMSISSPSVPDADVISIPPAVASRTIALAVLEVDSNSTSDALSSFILEATSSKSSVKVKEFSAKEISPFVVFVIVASLSREISAPVPALVISMIAPVALA